MSCYAAVVTGKGTGAISTIQVFGEKARSVIENIFRPATGISATFEEGKILLGTISSKGEITDQVTVGCEGPGRFAINCHGNPLIVADIMQLLQQNGASLLTAEQLLAGMLLAQKNINTIAVEAKLAQPNAKTLEGTKIINNQINTGLAKAATKWLDNINEISPEQIAREAERIIENSQTAKLIIYGCKIVLAGPPNSGKSTLFNCLCGKHKAVVTNVKGTTRDWVTANCRLKSLFIELFDTAGLDEKLSAAPDTIESNAQERSIQILEEAHLVLFVLDSSENIGQVDSRIIKKIADKKVVTVLNKTDLPLRIDTNRLPEILAKPAKIDAKSGTGIENLLEKIPEVLDVASFDLKQPVCFTERQENLLKQLSRAKSTSQAAPIITELLNGQVRV